MSKQRIGTTISMENSGIMLYPSLTFCPLPLSPRNITVDPITHTPGVSDVMVSLHTIDQRSDSTLIMTPYNRKDFNLPYSIKETDSGLVFIRTSYFYGHNALWRRWGNNFRVKFVVPSYSM